MPLNMEIIGKKTDLMPFKYDQDTVILYAQFIFNPKAFLLLKGE